MKLDFDKLNNLRPMTETINSHKNNNTTKKAIANRSAEDIKWSSKIIHKPKGKSLREKKIK